MLLMMKKNILLLVLIGILSNNIVIAQNNLIPYAKFETIEKLRLGLTKDKFAIAAKALKIKNKWFSSNMLTDKFWQDKNKRESNLINFYYTDMFNYEDFKVDANLLEHPTLIYPQSIDDKTITSIILLLGHTGKALGSSEMDSLKGPEQYFRQDINEELFFKITDLYTLKYGPPALIQDSLEQKKYYRLYKNYVITENENSYKNYILKWSTDYFNIEIFPGFNLNAFYIPHEWYSASTNWVSSNLDSEPLKDNEKPCFTFSYIKYELNEKALKLLKINQLGI